MKGRGKPARHKYPTTLSRLKNRLICFEICIVEVKICNRPICSILLKKCMCFNDCRSINAMENGRAKATTLIAMIAGEEVEREIQAPRASCEMPMTARRRLTSYMVFIKRRETCLVSLARGERSLSTVGPSISWCLKLGFDDLGSVE